ncbi:MAG: four helix bundle protein [Kiritimatiellia bacterium]
MYRAAFEAAMEIFELSKTWPKEERYSLTDQIRRSSRSVCGQVAEAWRKRRYTAHFRSKLTDADSEAAETQAWLEFALRCGYITQPIFDKLDATYENVSGGLVIMMDNAAQWCVSPNLVKEDGIEYVTTPTNAHTHAPTNSPTPKLTYPRTHTQRKPTSSPKPRKTP